MSVNIKEIFKNMVLRIIKTALYIATLSLFLTFVSSCDDDPTVTYNFTTSGDYQGAYWPTASWRTCSPEAVGMSSDRLNDLYDYMVNSQAVTRGLMVIRDGYIVAEYYATGFDENSRFASYSVAKSFLSALVGIAIDKGLISGVDIKAFLHLPMWQSDGTDPQKKEIALKHFLTMTSGLQWVENFNGPDEENDVFSMIASNDYLRYALDKPVVNAAGATWNYSGGDSMAISGILQHAVGETAYDFGQRYLFNSIGIPNIIWESDPAGRTIGGWGIEATVREFAKFGYLYMNNGVWNGAQIVSSKWVDESTEKPFAGLYWYGYKWWLAPSFTPEGATDIPQDTFAAMGLFGQKIYVIPAYNIVVVRTGADVTDYSKEWTDYQLVRLAIASVTE